MLDPYISVAIITYNQEQYIAQALESILSQQVDFSFEVVIGEDCSTDNTRGIVKDYKSRYPTAVRVVTSESNVGMMANLIRTLQACRGKFIAFCEGDDYWNNPKKLQKQFEFMKENPCLSMSFHAVKVEFVDGKRSGQIKRSYKGNKILTPKGVILGGGSLFKFTSTMIRGDVVDDLLLLYKDSPITDSPLALTAISKGYVGYLDKVLSVYRSHVENSWTEQIIKNPTMRLIYLMQLSQMRKSYDELTNFRYTKWIKKKNSINFRNFLVFTAMDQKQRLQHYKMLKTEMTTNDRVISLLSIYMNYYRIRLHIKTILMDKLKVTGAH